MSNFKIKGDKSPLSPSYARSCCFSLLGPEAAYCATQFRRKEFQSKACDPINKKQKL